MQNRTKGSALPQTSTYKDMPLEYWIYCIEATMDAIQVLDTIPEQSQLKEALYDFLHDHMKHRDRYIEGFDFTEFGVGA